jgi:hypothetical protein
MILRLRKREIHFLTGFSWILRSKYRKKMSITLQLDQGAFIQRPERTHWRDTEVLLEALEGEISLFG